MIQSQPYTFSFLKKTEIAQHTYSFFFKRPENFDFIAGQYNRWTLPITATDGRGSSRFFTISSSPEERESVSLTTKIIQSDFKKALLELKEGDEIKIFGPMGNFILDESDNREKVFIAGGIGITPFHSILLSAAAKNLAQSLTLLASFSTPEEMAFRDELAQIAESHPSLKVIYTATKPEESTQPWEGEKGRVSEDLIKKYVKDPQTSVFYMAGPPPMVDGAKKLLEGMHIPEENIKLEQFTGY